MPAVGRCSQKMKNTREIFFSPPFWWREERGELFFFMRGTKNFGLLCMALLFLVVMQERERERVKKHSKNLSKKERVVD